MPKKPPAAVASASDPADVPLFLVDNRPPAARRLVRVTHVLLRTPTARYSVPVGVPYPVAPAVAPAVQAAKLPPGFAWGSPPPPADPAPLSTTEAAGTGAPPKETPDG